MKVDAVKRALSKQRLEQLQIKIRADKDYVSIRTEYPDRDNTFGHDRDHDQPASVGYTLTARAGRVWTRSTWLAVR